MSLFLSRHIKKRLFPILPSSIKFKTNDTNLILKSFQERTWQEINGSEAWDILWADKQTVQEVFVQQVLKDHQRINGFPNEIELIDEVRRLRNMKKYMADQKDGEKVKENEEFCFVPRSYIMPEDYEKLRKASLKEDDGPWTVKNEKSLQGLLQDPPAGSMSESFVIQERIKNPFMIGGKQPMLNILCLVKSFLPLTVYLYRDGFVSLSTPNSQSISFNNLKIQSHNSSDNDSFWSLRKFKNYLISKNDPKKIDDCFLDIQKVIIKILESVQKRIPKSRNSFALYNFQISLDSSLKPWLISIDSNPIDNLPNTEEILQAKTQLLDDLFTIVDMEKIFTGLEDQIGGFDLIALPTFQTARPKIRSSKLGYVNTRDTQLSKLAKEAVTRLMDAYIQKKNKPEPTRLQFCHTENNLLAVKIPPIITSISPQNSDGRTIDLTPTKPGSNLSTRIFNNRRAPRHFSDPQMSRNFQANSPVSKLKRFISDNSTGDMNTPTSNCSLPLIKFPSPVRPLLPSMTERTPQHKSTSNTPRHIRKNKNLPPIIVNSEDRERDTERLNKSKFEMLLEEAGYDVQKNPISILEAGTPSTAASLREMAESQKMSEMDEKVLRILHRRSRIKREMKETQSYRVLSSSTKLTKEEVKKLLMKSRTSNCIEDLGEIKEEEEYIMKPSR